MVAMESLSYKARQYVFDRQVSHSQERAHPVHGYWALILDPVAALDVLLLAFLKQLGSCGHTNSHGYSRFSPVKIRWAA
ncbi:MAG TPA: hypothetical protein VGR71_00865 [Nitrospira sp.]|nr:hypothetical protein [Nitrospira sp.]